MLSRMVCMKAPVWSSAEWECSPPSPLEGSQCGTPHGLTLIWCCCFTHSQPETQIAAAVGAGTGDFSGIGGVTLVQNSVFIRATPASVCLLRENSGEGREMSRAGGRREEKRVS